MSENTTSHATMRIGQRLSAVIAAVAVAMLSGGCGGDDLSNPSGTFETTTVEVAPLETGRVLAVRFDEGDLVSVGDTLIVLDTEPIALHRAELVAGRAAQAAQHSIAAEELAQAERQLVLIETTLERTQRLRSTGSATQQQVDDLTTQRDVARSRVGAARGRLDQIDAELERLAASLAVIDWQLSEGVVTAPIAGTVLVRSTEPGEVATAGRGAMRLADLRRLDLRVYLEAADLDRVRLGQEVGVLVDALPGKRLTGRVAWISDEAEFTPKNVQTRNARAQLVYAVKVRVENPDGRLHIGMPAEVEIE